MTPAAVGTIDQLLMVWQGIKYGVIRIAALTDKVLIIDEIHAADEYMLESVKKLLSFCGWMGISVIALSATLPEETKKALITNYIHGQDGSSYIINGVNKKLKKKIERTDLILSDQYPLITEVAYNHNTKKGDIKEYPFQATKKINYQYATVPLLDADESEVISLAFEKVKNGGCCAIIVNTVKRSQRLYTLIKENSAYDGKVYLVHARYPYEIKEEQAKELNRLFGPDRSNRPAKSIVISTQIIEQSLDVDFDFMITDLAPIDLLIQRFGRYRRHDDIGTIRETAKKSDQIIVLIPDKHNKSGQRNEYSIYNPIVMDITDRLLRETPGYICTPDDIRGLISYVYDDDDYMPDGCEIAQGAAALMKSPYSNIFELYNLEEHNSLTATKETRYSKYSTCNVAIVDEELYEKLLLFRENRNLISFEEQRQIYKKYVITIPTYTITDPKTLLSRI